MWRCISCQRTSFEVKSELWWVKRELTFLPLFLLWNLFVLASQTFQTLEHFFSLTCRRWREASVRLSVSSYDVCLQNSLQVKFPPLSTCKTPNLHSEFNIFELSSFEMSGIYRMLQLRLWRALVKRSKKSLTQFTSMFIDLSKMFWMGCVFLWHQQKLNVRLQQEL